MIAPVWNRSDGRTVEASFLTVPLTLVPYQIPSPGFPARAIPLTSMSYELTGCNFFSHPGVRLTPPLSFFESFNLGYLGLTPCPKLCAL